MTSRTSGSRNQREPSQYISAADSPVDVVVMDAGSHLVACWTAPVHGRREVVGIDVLPRPEEVLTLTPEWFQARRDSFEGVPLVPVPVTLLRSIPLRQALAERKTFSETLARADEASLWVEKIEDLPKPDPSEVSPEVEAVLSDPRTLAYLFDAVLYVAAIEQGQSPREVIAKANTISPRSAEARVAKARDLGLLTKATSRRAAGELTPLAEQVLEIVGPLLKEVREGGRNG